MMYTGKQKFTLVSLILKTALFVAAACVGYLYYEIPHPSGLNSCQLGVLTDHASPSENQWTQFEEWCEHNVYDQEEKETTLAQAAYLWWNKKVVDKCHAYTGCTSYAGLQTLCILSVSLFLFGTYIRDVLLIKSSYFFGKGKKAKKGLRNKKARGLHMLKKSVFRPGFFYAK